MVGTPEHDPGLIMLTVSLFVYILQEGTGGWSIVIGIDHLCGSGSWWVWLISLLC
jgi:hypothetical protein